MSRFSAFVAQMKQRIYQDLLNNSSPSLGDWSVEILKEGRAKGRPQMGAAIPYQDRVVLEFTFPDTVRGATILAVTVQAPERVVLMPVPVWVVENIWQGDVQGSHVFESEARELLAAYALLLEPEANAALFGPRPPVGRR